MPAKKKTARRTRAGQTPVKKAAKALAKTWEGTREAFGNAEVAVQRRVRALVKHGGARTQQASETLVAWRGQLERERRKAMKQLEQRLATLQTRARRERKAFVRIVEDRVQGALAALNIPSRQEVHDLTRRVEELSRKIDGLRRPGAPRRAATTRMQRPAQA